MIYLILGVVKGKHKHNHYKHNVHFVQANITTICGRALSRSKFFFTYAPSAKNKVLISYFLKAGAKQTGKSILFRGRLSFAFFT